MNQKKILWSLITFIMILSLAMPLSSSVVRASPATEIWDWYDLDAMREDLEGSYVLMTDLDSTTAGYPALASPDANGGKGWSPIGTEDHAFTGAFHGQGYEIEGLFIDRADERDVGLFGSVLGGLIEDVGLLNITVIGEWQVGALVGRNQGDVNYCYSSGSVTGYGYVGPVVGAYVGGLVGSNEGTVSNCYSTASVTGDDWFAGGLVGRSFGTVSNSYFAGTVTAPRYAGGLVGYHWGTVSNSHYNYDEILINGENIITVGALFGEDFEEWLANDKFLDVNERLSQENGFYVINDVDDFKQLLAFGQDNSLKFRLKGDLDLATEPSLYIPYLAGEFHGNRHKISNLSIDFHFLPYVGLFGYLAPNGKVSRLGVENASVSGHRDVGGLVGFNDDGIIGDSYSSGSMSGTSSVGGLVGGNRGTVGGSYSTSSVAAFYGAGGLVGSNPGTVTKSHSSGSVSGTRFVGGLVGDNIYGVVSNSYSSSAVTGSDDRVGGLVGDNRGSVTNSYSNGSVIGGSEVGGLVGENSGTMTNSYSIGSVSGAERVGGLVGYNEGTVSNSFWDVETFGMEESGGGTGKTTTEMMDVATFTDTDTEGLDQLWDMTGVSFGETDDAYTWSILDGETYPFLSWEGYDLNISSTAGGSVVVPGEVVFTYLSGTTVDLVADAGPVYRFVGWTGDVDTVADVSAAATTITMHGNYIVTANFEINWPLIGGLIAAAAVAGSLVFFLVRRRAASKGSIS